MKFEDLENLLSLHAHEEKLRGECIKIIDSDPDLIESMALIAKAMNVFFAFTHGHENKDDDELTLQFLGIRQFNTATASLKLALGGYVQSALALTRDILEVAFLLDYFRTDRSMIHKWKSATPKELKRDFSPLAIRMVLDKRDGNVEQKRKQVYELLSEYASHAGLHPVSLTRT